jgi:hypothetical protein
MADSLLQTERRTISQPVMSSMSGRRVSWGAIISGVVVALVVQMLLSILGIAVGAATIDAAGSVTTGVGIGAGIWFAASGIIAFYCAGWTAGRMAGIPRAVESTMHGFLAWGVAFVVGALMVTSAIGGLLGGAANILGRAATGGGGGNQLSSAISGAAGQARNVINQQGGTGGVAQQAQQAGQAAADNVAGVSLAGFLVLLLGAGAGALGGYVSTPKNTILTSLPAWERRGSSLR